MRRMSGIAMKDVGISGRMRNHGRRCIRAGPIADGDGGMAMAEARWQSGEGGVVMVAWCA